MLASRVRNRARRLAGSVGIAVLIGSVLAACGGGSSGSQGSAKSGSITWWGWTPEVAAAKNYIAAFNKTYPDIKVTYKQLQISGYDAAMRPALASSVGPDVYGIAPGGGIASIATLGRFAEDLTPAVTNALGSDWKSKIAPIGPSGMTTEDGKLAGLPVGSTYAGTLWTNKDLFDKYHLTPPTNLDEWATVCATFKSHGVGCFVQGAGQVAFNQDTLQAITDTVAPGVWTKASKGELPWTDPAIVKALTIWKQLFDKGIMEPGALGVQQYPDAHNAFMGGKYAMVMMGTWYMQFSTAAGMAPAVSASGVSGAKPFTAEAIRFPDVSGAGNPAPMFGDPDYGVAVNSKSKHRAAATTFVTWLTTSTAGQQIVANTLNDIASLNSVKPQWNQVKLVNASAQQPVLEKLIDDVSTSTEPRLSLLSAHVAEAIGVASTTVAAGKASPEEAARTLQASASAAN